MAELWSKHRPLATEVANEIIQLQQKLTGRSLNKKQLIERMVHAFNGDPEHGCMGRSAVARLERAFKQADEHGLDLPRLKHIVSKV